MRRNGLDVKTSIPPGPDNPLGKHWIGLSEPGIGIPGTIAPVRIYGFHSHGCIRLHPYDAQRLYGQVSLGEAVTIVSEPALLARFVDGRIHVEVHRDAYRKDVDALATLKRLVDEQGLAPSIDWRKVKVAVSQKAGAMRDVTLKPLPMNGSGK